jgi:hypothetical protein
LFTIHSLPPALPVSLCLLTMASLILNPLTGRMVKANGRVGKALVAAGHIAPVAMRPPCIELTGFDLVSLPSSVLQRIAELAVTVEGDATAAANFAQTCKHVHNAVYFSDTIKIGARNFRVPLEQCVLDARSRWQFSRSSEDQVQLKFDFEWRNQKQAWEIKFWVDSGVMSFHEAFVTMANNTYCIKMSKKITKKCVWGNCWAFCENFGYDELINNSAKSWAQTICAVIEMIQQDWHALQYRLFDALQEGLIALLEPNGPFVYPALINGAPVQSLQRYFKDDAHDVLIKTRCFVLEKYRSAIIEPVSLALAADVL